jgi:crotonobetainyl-CoA:carnitine CoA-transferase CaiB-like acyl-CoA transferase
VPYPFLTGLRVLDLSQYIPGPYATLILADLGADVIKVEPPGGEPMRRVGPRDQDGVSPWYKMVNGGKTVVEIDLKDPAGKRDFQALVEGSDALLESYRPGVLDRLGFGHEALHEMNPRIVSCSLSGWGLSGPYHLRGGHDINYMALMGGLDSSGVPERPVVAFPPTADFASGMQAALSIMGGLLGRDRPSGSGRGATIDVSISETVLPWQVWALNGLLREGWEVPRAAQFPNGGAAFYNIYETKDGRFITLGALEDKFWHNFCNAVGHAEWVERQWEPRPQTALIAEVGSYVGGKTLDEMNALMDGVDCCYEPVHHLEDVPDHPHIKARGMLRKHEGPDPTYEILFPGWVDGKPPPERPPVNHSGAADVLAAWKRAQSSGD